MRAPRRLGACEGAVSEVVGYILVFFLSSAVLILSLQAFLLARTTTDELRAGNELRLVSERIAAEVLQAGAVAADLPDAVYEATVHLPPLAGRSYYVRAAEGKVVANTTDGMISAESTALNVEALGSLTLQGTVYSSQGYVKIKYERADDGTRTITLTI